MAHAEEKRILGILRKSPVLADASTDALARLATAAQLQSYQPRRVVFLPGDRAVGVHFLASGRVKISKVTRDGKELPWPTGQPGISSARAPCSKAAHVKR